MRKAQVAQVSLRSLKKGEYFTRKAVGGVVWVRGEYNRSTGKYDCHKFEDINATAEFLGGRLVTVGFTF